MGGNLKCMEQQSESDLSYIGQLDGNTTISDINQTQLKQKVNPISDGYKTDKIYTAKNLPVVAAYNCQSLFPQTWKNCLAA